MAGLIAAEDVILAAVAIFRYSGYILVSLMSHYASMHYILYKWLVSYFRRGQRQCMNVFETSDRA